jgi:hypothetical protein
MLKTIDDANKGGLIDAYQPPNTDLVRSRARPDRRQHSVLNRSNAKFGDLFDEDSTKDLMELPRQVSRLSIEHLLQPIVRGRRFRLDVSRMVNHVNFLCTQIIRIQTKSHLIAVTTSMLPQASRRS